MDVREFISEIKGMIRDYLPDDIYKDVIIDDVEIVKMNDQKLHGLTFRMPGSDAAPTIYVDDLYQEYTEGTRLGYLAVEVANRYTESRNTPVPPAVDLSFDNVKDRLTVRPIEKSRNRDFLRNMPHVSVGNGLAVICDINMGEDRVGDWRIAVNNSVLEQLGVDSETLFAEAMRSSMAVEPPMLIDMTSALFSPEKVNLLDRSEPISPEDKGSMFVLTNASGSLGASVLFYPEVKEKAAEIIGTGYYVLPSSVHEVILVPEAPGIQEKDLCEMVKQANRTVVESKDILSDNVYHYSREDRRLDKVDPEKDRGDRVAEGR